MLKDMEFENSWGKIPEEDKLKFVALQQWNMSKRLEIIEGKPVYCPAHQELILKMKSKTSSSGKGSKVATALKGGGFIGGVVLIEYLLRRLGWTK